MDEAEIDGIRDGYDDGPLPERTKIALRFTDAFLAARPPSAGNVEAMRAEFTPEEIAEMAMGLALFHGFSKFLIVTGCEPEEMGTTVLDAPGAPPR